MAGNRTGKVLKRRRSDASVSKLFAYKHKNTPNNKNIQRPLFTERYFWLLACCIIIVWILVRVFDFSLVPLSYRGLYINKPFNGFHSWLHAADAWAARSHVHYGLGYTKGYNTLVVGDAPPANPQRYVSHPQLPSLIQAFGMLLLGTKEWAIRLFDLILSIPALLLTIYFLSRLYGCSVALLSGLLLVLTPIFSYFAFDYLTVL